MANGSDTEDQFRHIRSPTENFTVRSTGSRISISWIPWRQNGCPVKEEWRKDVPGIGSCIRCDRGSGAEDEIPGVKIFLNEPVKDIVIREEKAAGIILEKSGKTVEADAVVIATGGSSYPSTGVYRGTDTGL